MTVPRLQRGYVLVGGWPGSGKTTLARALARELGLAYVGKDEAKEALMDVLGAPPTVEESQRLGRAAVAVVLRLTRGCPAAVVDSTWFPGSLDAVEALPGPCLEVRCVLPLEVARQRYHARVRDPRHLDAVREESELWAEPVAALGVGPLIEVDTSGAVDVARIATRVLETMGE